MTRNLRKTSHVAASAALILAATPMVVLGTATAANAACEQAISQNLSPEEPQAWGDSPLRTGPSQDCGLLDRADNPSETFRIRCWVKNNAGNYWYSGTLTSGITGWMYEQNIFGTSIHRSPGYRCPGD